MFSFLPHSQADRSRTLGVIARSIFQWTTDGEGTLKAMRADEPDPAPEETLSQRTRLGRDAAGVCAPQPFGVSVSVQERTLELQFGWPRKSSETRSVNAPNSVLLSVQVHGCGLLFLPFSLIHSKRKCNPIKLIEKLQDGICALITLSQNYRPEKMSGKSWRDSFCSWWAIRINIRSKTDCNIILKRI